MDNALPVAPRGRLLPALHRVPGLVLAVLVLVSAHEAMAVYLAMLHAFHAEPSTATPGFQTGFVVARWLVTGGALIGLLRLGRGDQRAIRLSIVALTCLLIGYGCLLGSTIRVLVVDY